MLFGAAPGSAKRDDPKKDKDARTILVKFVSGIDADASVSDEGDKGAGELKTKVKIVKVKGDSSIDDAIARYSARDDVEYAEANYLASADSPTFGEPDDPSYGIIDPCPPPLGADHEVELLLKPRRTWGQRGP